MPRTPGFVDEDGRGDAVLVGSGARSQVERAIEIGLEFGDHFAVVSFG